MNIVNINKIEIVSAYNDKTWDIKDDYEGLKVRCYGSWYLVTEKKGELQLNEIEEAKK